MSDKNNITISLAREADRIWAARLMSSSDPWITLGVTLKQCLETCHNLDNRIYIAKGFGKLCGVIILQDCGVAGSPYIKSLAIDPDYRGQGIGKELLKFAEETYRQTSRHLFLCVSSFNHHAQKFYLNNGYERIGELKDYIKPGYSEILMHKQIS